MIWKTTKFASGRQLEQADHLTVVESQGESPPTWTSAMPLVCSLSECLSWDPAVSAGAGSQHWRRCCVLARPAGSMAPRAAWSVAGAWQGVQSTSVCFFPWATVVAFCCIQAGAMCVCGPLLSSSSQQDSWSYSETEPSASVQSLGQQRTWKGFPGGSVGKNPLASAGDARDHGFNPWSRKMPWSRKWQLALVFLPRKCLGRRILVASSLWGHKEPDVTEHTHMHIYAKGVENWMWVLNDFSTWKLQNHFNFPVSFLFFK